MWLAAPSCLKVGRELRLVAMHSSLGGLGRRKAAALLPLRQLTAPRLALFLWRLARPRLLLAPSALPLVTLRRAQVRLLSKQGPVVLVMVAAWNSLDLLLLPSKVGSSP